MNENIKRDWVDALREGNYEQCNNALKNDQGCFCALGVLCDLAVKAGIAKWEPSDNPEKFAIVSIDGEAFEPDLLPKFIQQWAGINDCDPDLVLDGETHSVSELNDRFGWRFEDFAYHIDDQL